MSTTKGKAIAISHVEKLSHNRDALTAAYRSSFHLQEKGLMHWSPVSWDEKAIIASIEDKPVAVVNYSVNENTLVANIDYAFCAPDCPKALTKCLLVLRCLLRLDSRVKELRYTYHSGNEDMHKAGHLLRAELHSLTYTAKL